MKFTHLLKYGTLVAERWSMKKSGESKERLSIDVKLEEHMKIKLYAARLGMSIRSFVLESIRQRLTQEEEKQHTLMTSYPGPVLKEVWENDQDAAYDNL